jgi:hypothetical protein
VLPAERLVIRDEEGAGIPALLVRPEGTGPWPAVVVQHGYGPVDKTSVLPLAVYLAERGFMALLPDAWGHGERFPAAGPNWMTDISADYFLDVLRHTTDEMVHALDVLAARDDARRDALLVAGFSMGAMAALLTGTEDPRVAGVISASGSAAPDLLSLTIAGSRPAGEAARAWALAHDAAARLGRLAPRPLLLQHGRADDFVPIANTLRLYDAAQPLYAAQPDHLALMLYDHAHDVTPRQIEDAVEWLAPRFTPEPRHTA